MILTKAEKFAKRTGRHLVVDGWQWIWKLGRGGHVLAYREDGVRTSEHAGIIKGTTPDIWDRGRHKKTSDGRLLPSEVTKWLRSEPWKKKIRFSE